MIPLKVLFIDIETAPAITNMWRPDDRYIPMDMLIAPGFMLNWGAKWRGQKSFKSGLVDIWEAQERDDRRIVQDLADLIRQADVVVGHNIDGFDLPRINDRVLFWQLEPLGPVQTIDTYKIAKASLGLLYNKLDYLGLYLGEGRKLKTDMDLWKECVDGKLDALKKMQRYNRQDVLLLERVFERLIPYAKKLPRLFDATGPRQCVYCGSENLVGHGHTRTAAGTYQRLKCNDCGRTSRRPTQEKALQPGLRPT